MGETTATATQAVPEPEAIEAPTPAAVARLREPAHRSLEEMIDHRVVRLLVTYNRTFFFFDGAVQRGLSADIGHELEKFLNRKLGLPRSSELDVAFIPVRRDQLITHLASGRGDLAMGNLTVTAARRELVDFSRPLVSGVREVIVSGPSSPPLSNLADLAGQRVYVRPSSSFHESLEFVSESLISNGLAPIEIVAASEVLETEDLLEMVAAGLIPFSVADGHIARFWAQVLPDLEVHEDVAIAEGGDIAWAIRKTATGLDELVDEFVQSHGVGTLVGNVILKRYFERTEHVDHALETEDRRRFASLAAIFQRYAGEYDFDYLLIVAQGYQESRLDQSARSRAGAIGVMQLLPATAADKAVGIPDISTAESNIHAGTKYLRYLVDRYFDDPEIDEVDQLLFAFGAYNAGPARMRRVRAKAAGLGYDPNQWFRHVERAMATEVGREPVRYVRNIFKYYTAYHMALEQGTLRDAERKKRRE